MSPHGWVALAVLLVAAWLFLTRKLPIEATALAIPLVLFATGTVPDAAVALQGFGNPAVIALAAVFVLGAGLQESGVAELLARRLQPLCGTSELRTVAVIGVVVTLLSAFVANAATVAMLLPAVLSLCRNAGVSPRRALMPLSFAALLGGNLTLIGTAPNLLVADYLEQRAGISLGLLDFALVGAPLAAAGLLSVVLFSRRQLPGASDPAPSQGNGTDALASAHGLDQKLTRLHIERNSKLVGRTLGELLLHQRYDVQVVLVARHQGLVLHWRVPEATLTLQAGDDLYLDGSPEAIWTLAEEQLVQVGLAGSHHVEHVLDRGVVLAEVLVGPRSRATGRTLRELRFRHEHQLSVINIRRGEERHTHQLGRVPLDVGDVLLVAGSVGALRRLRQDDDFVVLSATDEPRDVRRAPLALVFLALALLPPLLGLAPLAVSALAGALLMSLTGCVAMHRAGRFIEWKVLALIVGTLPLGQALEAHGVAALAAEGILGAASPVAALALLFGAATLLSVTAGNAAAAVVLAPVASSVAGALGLDPRAPLLAVAYGCSCAFVVPFNQCNLIVLSPGRYRSTDFLRAGWLPSLVVGATAVACLTLLMA